jgi:hypothetical protein
VQSADSPQDVRKRPTTANDPKGRLRWSGAVFSAIASNRHQRGASSSSTTTSRTLLNKTSSGGAMAWVAGGVPRMGGQAAFQVSTMGATTGVVPPQPILCALWGRGKGPSWVVQARTHVPFSLVRPMLRSRRRLSPATRWGSQLLFFSMLRYGTRRFPRVSQAIDRSTIGRCCR